MRQMNGVVFEFFFYVVSFKFNVLVRSEICGFVAIAIADLVSVRISVRGKIGSEDIGLLIWNSLNNRRRLIICLVH